MNRTLLVLACCLSALSQEFRATLSGRITDPSGASVAGAKVDARALATGNTQSTVSNADGIYVLPNLNPGEYTLTVEKTGFSKIVRGGLRLSLAERAVAEEDGVGAAREIEAIEVVAVEIHAEREKIPLRRAGGDAAADCQLDFLTKRSVLVGARSLGVNRGG